MQDLIGQYLPFWFANISSKIGVQILSFLARKSKKQQILIPESIKTYFYNTIILVVAHIYPSTLLPVSSLRISSIFSIPSVFAVCSIYSVFAFNAIFAIFSVRAIFAISSISAISSIKAISSISKGWLPALKVKFVKYLNENIEFC